MVVISRVDPEINDVKSQNQQQLIDSHKWFLERCPESGTGGYIFFSRCLNKFQFFTEEEKEAHEFGSSMREVATDEFAKKTLEQIVRSQDTMLASSSTPENDSSF